jgi:hypothetical protein
MLAKLQPRQPSNHHRLVLFCTQSDRIHFGNCVVEFPTHAEIRGNGTLVPANLRGIKNKPGTINPPDITPQCILMQGVNNKIDVTFAESRSVCLVMILTIGVYFDGLSRGETYGGTISGENSKERLHL